MAKRRQKPDPPESPKGAVKRLKKLADRGLSARTLVEVFGGAY